MRIIQLIQYFLSISQSKKSYFFSTKVPLLFVFCFFCFSQNTLAVTKQPLVAEKKAKQNEQINEVKQTNKSSPLDKTKIIDKKVASLLKKMSLAEKLREITQGYIFKETELQLINKNFDELMKSNETNPNKDLIFERLQKNQFGSMLGVTTPEAMQKIQEFAIKNSPNKIPILFAYDTIHGFKTVFPIPLAEAASWEPQLAEKTSRVAAIETRAQGIRWTFAPMVDIAQDPRWGRVIEGAGEDPYLASLFSAARVKGFQGKNMADSDSLMATMKHFAAYGRGEGGRDYNSVDISETLLRELIFPPFQAGLNEGAGSVMVSFNTINGVPSSVNSYLLETILRKEWKFPGLVVGDWQSTQQVIAHGVAANDKEAAEKSLKAGVDIEMSSMTYENHVAQLIKEKKLSMKILDKSVERVLRQKYLVGLFDDPSVDPTNAKKMLLKPEHRELARESARRSIVLLKNEKNILPLSKKVPAIALIGGFAAERESLMGAWSGDGQAKDVVTILEGLRAKLSDTPSQARSSLLGEVFPSEEVFSVVNPIPTASPSPASDKPGTLVNNPVPLVTPVAATENLPSKFKNIYKMTEQGLTYNPVNIEIPKEVSKLPNSLTFKAGATEVHYFKGCDQLGNCTDKDIEKAAKLAQKAGLALLVLGEYRSLSGEARSVTQLELPGRQRELIKAVVKTGVPVVLVLSNGRPLALTWEEEESGLTAILETWQLGSEAGNAIADVLFGDYNPSGKLPMSFPRSVGQIPVYYNHLNTGRPAHETQPGEYTSYYADSPNTPLYPFGFGLSYTQFKISDLKLSDSSLESKSKANNKKNKTSANESDKNTLRISVTLENTGSRFGEEVLQLYVRDLVASVARPVKELKGFQKIALAPKEKKKVEFTLKASDLQFFSTIEKKWITEPGAFQLWIGSSSEASRSLTTQFELK